MTKTKAKSKYEHIVELRQKVQIKAKDSEKCIIDEVIKARQKFQTIMQEVESGTSVIAKYLPMLTLDQLKRLEPKMTSNSIDYKTQCLAETLFADALDPITVQITELESVKESASNLMAYCYSEEFIIESTGMYDTASFYKLFLKTLAKKETITGSMSD